MRLKACINGSRTRAQHPGIPVSAADLAAEAERVVAAGADAVHLHVKDDDGLDSLDSARMDAALAAVRRAVPGIPLGVTTGAWALRNPEQRVAAIRAWRTLPDFASVNWIEEGSDEVAAALLERGVAVEAGLWSVEAIEAWLASPSHQRCCRVLVEMIGPFSPGRTEADADVFLAMIGASSGRDVPVLLHGYERSCWPVLRHAAGRGLAVRIGLEDTLELPDGSRTVDNANLVRCAAQILREAGESR